MSHSGVAVINFMFGAIAIASLVISAFFLQFYLKLKDRFFALFSFAFFLFFFEKVTLVFVDQPNESHPAIYLIRLAGFLVIIYAILDKNRATSAK